MKCLAEVRHVFSLIPKEPSRVSEALISQQCDTFCFAWEEIKITLKLELVFDHYYHVVLCVSAAVSGIPLNKIIKTAISELRTAHHWSNSSPSVEHACGSITLEASFRNMGNNEGAKYRQNPHKSLSRSESLNLFFSRSVTPSMQSR